MSVDPANLRPGDDRLPDELAGLPNAVLRVRAGRVVDFNGSFLALTGLERAQVVGASAAGLFAVASRSELTAAWASPGAARLRAGLLAADGVELPVEISLSSQGGDNALLLFDPLLREAVAASQLLPTLVEAAGRLRYLRSEDEVLALATEALHRAGLWAGAFVVEGDELVFRHLSAPEWIRAGLERVTGRAPVGRRFAASELSLCQRAFAERRAIRDLEFQASLARFYGGAVGKVAAAAATRLGAATGVREGIVLPTFAEGRAVAALLGYGGRLTADDVSALELFASEVSAALEHTAFVRSLERRNRELSLLNRLSQAASVHDPVGAMGAAAQVLLELASADLCAVYLVHPGESDLVLTARSGGGPAVEARIFLGGALGRSAQGGAAFSLEGVEASAALAGCAQVLGQPLLLRGRLAGLALLGRRGGPLSASGRAVLETAAAQLGVALENAELYASAQRQVRAQLLLNEVSRRVSGSLDPREQLDLALAAVVGRLPFDGGGAALWGPSPQLAGALKVEAGLAAKVGQALAQRKARAECEAVPLAELGELGEELARAGHRRLVVAWLAPERGALWLVRQADLPLEADDAATLAAVAAQLALAVDKARLYEQAKSRLTDLELVQEVSDAIAGTLELQTVLESSAIRLARITGALGCELFLVDAERGGVLRWVRGRDKREPTRETGLDALTQALAQRKPALSQSGAWAWLALPLLHRDRLVGAALLAAPGERSFSNEEAMRGQVITNQVASAVENARLFDDLKHSYEALARAQGQLVKRERLAALGELAAVVAHEVRNPLGVIFNSVTSLKKLVRPSLGDAAMLLDIVGEEADRLNRIVGDLLDFARAAEPAVAPVDVERLLDEVVDTARSGVNPPGLQLSREYPAELPKVPMDERLMRQALLNLVLNALQAMPRGGRLGVRACLAEQAGHPAVRLEVEDNGVGIPDELKERIFEPFFTTKATGTGLGLAVVRRIVEDHGGEVVVRSAVGRGTTVALTLPLVPAERANKPALEPISLTP